MKDTIRQTACCNCSSNLSSDASEAYNRVQGRPYLQFWSEGVQAGPIDEACGFGSMPILYILWLQREGWHQI